MAPTDRHMECILKVDTRSSGWEKTVTKVIKCVKDVSYTIDTTRGIVHISGTINPEKILTDIKKAGKRAEIIHVDCAGSSHSHSHSHSHSNYGSYGYHGYDGGYGYSDPHHHTYHHHHHQSKPGGYIQSHQNARVLPSAPLLQWHHQSFSPPRSYGYDSYNPNPSCNIM